MPGYGIATLLEACPVGYEFRASATPLHLTHVDSFAVDLDVMELETRLRQLVMNFKPFTVSALADELWGPDKNIPVTTLELTPELCTLHNAIMKMLDASGATLKNPQFHRNDFSPHVSIYDNRRVRVGEAVAISDISLATRISDEDDPTHRILATVDLDTPNISDIVRS